MSDKYNRAAWTEFVTGKSTSSKPSKFHNERTGKYASKHEANVATNLHALARAGVISNLEEQVPIVLVPGRDGVRSITYISDFQYVDSDGVKHTIDAKGAKTNTYKIKKRLAYLLHGISIEEC